MSANYTPIPEGAEATPALWNDRFDAILAGDVFNVMRYEATGDGTTDDGEAITDAADALIANGGGTLFFPPGDYMVFKVGTVYTNLATFDGLEGVSIVMAEGATLKIDPARTGGDAFTTSYGSAFKFTDCRNIRLQVPRVTGPNVLDLSGSVKGIVFAYFLEGCDGITIPYLNVEGGCVAAVEFDNSADASITANKCRNIDIGILKVSDSWYGIAGVYSGDNLTCKLLRTDTVFRAIICYGVANWDVFVKSTDHKGGHVALQSIAGYGCANMRIGYATNDSTAAADHPHIQMSYDVTPGFFRNIELNLNVELSGAASGGPVLSILKLDAVNASDTADRGHILDGLKISGRIDGNPSEATGGVLGTHPDCDWSTGDFWDKIELSDLEIDDARFVRFNVGSMAGKAVTLRNVRSDNSIQFVTSRTETQTGPAKIECINCDFTNQYVQVSGESAFPIVHLAEDATTHTVAAGWMNGRLYTNVLMGQTQTLTLPAGAPGLRMRFLCVNAHDLRIDPNGSETIRGGGAGKYLELETIGEAVELLWNPSASVWEIVASNGTLSFEP